MADYYSILSKTISGMAQNSQGTRQAVYAKARSAIDRQLRAMEPTPSEDAIARQMGLLEDAIAKIEVDHATPPVPIAENPDPDAPVHADISSKNMAVEGQVVNPSVSATSDGAHGPAPVVEPHINPNEPVNPANAGYTPAGSAAQVAPSVDPLGMDYSETILAQNPETQSVPANGKPAKKKLGFLGDLLPIVLALGVIGGGAYALWLNKDALIEGLFGGGDTPAQTADNKTPVDDNNGVIIADDKPGAPAPEKQVRVVGTEAPGEKSSAKLTNDGKTVEVAPIVEPIDSQPIPADPVVPDAPAVDTETPVAVEKPVAPAANENAPDTNADPVVIAKNSENPDVATPPESTTPAVAQKAFLYEEGASGSNASRDNAAIIWSLGKENVDGVDEAVINGKLDVPGRNLSMNLKIKRNNDESLPASHIIELQFNLPSDFSGGNISNVSRFVMKASEQDRGNGLIAVPAKISDGNFLIALNNLDQALITNRKLLLESSWIDVPVGYTTGRRALVTLEKGAIGNKVFKEAFADWDKRK